MMTARPRILKPGVKVLSEKSHSEVLKMVDDFRKSEEAKGSVDAANINLEKSSVRSCHRVDTGWSIKIERRGQLGFHCPSTGVRSWE